MPADISGTLGNYAVGAANIGVILIVTLVFIAVFSFIGLLYSTAQKYKQFRCVAWSKDAFGNIKEEYYKAGIFVDRKTKNQRFFIRHPNLIMAMVKPYANLDADKVPVVTTKKGQIVYLRKTGHKNFAFIKPVLSEDNFEAKVSEEDINSALNTFEREKKRFDQSIWMQLLPYIALVIVSIIILIIFIYFFKDFDTLREMAIAMKEAATELAKYHSNSTVLPAAP